MGRNSEKNIHLIISVFEQNMNNLQRRIQSAATLKDWVGALINQAKVESVTELLEVVKALGLKTSDKDKEKENV